MAEFLKKLRPHICYLLWILNEDRHTGKRACKNSAMVTWLVIYSTQLEHKLSGEIKAMVTLFVLDSAKLEHRLSGVNKAMVTRLVFV